MKITGSRIWFAVIALFACWLALAARGTSADKVDAKDKIKDLQKQRLDALMKARERLVKQLENGFLPGAADTAAFMTQLRDVTRLVCQARLDLCAGKQERIKVIEESIKEFAPTVEALEKRQKAGVGNATVDFHLAQASLLELKISLSTSPCGRLI
jgi:cob(I)alamin adenosyltransferase